MYDHVFPFQLTAVSLVVAFAYRFTVCFSWFDSFGCGTVLNYYEFLPFYYAYASTEY